MTRYTIYKDGINTYAYNGKDGNIDFKGIDSAVVINNAITASSGGNIIIRAGLYDINQSINLNPNAIIRDTKLSIEGETPYVSGINEPTNLGATILRQNTNVDLISGMAPTGLIQQKTIKNLFLLGRSGTYTGKGIYISAGNGILIDTVTCAYFADRSIHLRFVNYGTIHNVTCRNGSHRGIQIDGTKMTNSIGTLISNCRIMNQATLNGDGIVLAEGVYKSRITNCYINGNGGTGFYTENGNTEGVENADNSITNSILSSNNIGADVEYSNRINISDCTICNNNSHGILGASSSSHLKVIGCTIEDNGGYGIARTSGNAWMIIGNSIRNNVSGQIQGYDTTSIVKNNQGYNTETTILSEAFKIDSVGIKTIIISHYLDIIPTTQDCYITVVEDTSVDDWGYDLIKIESINATNVIVKINVSRTSKTIGATAKLALKI